MDLKVLKQDVSQKKCVFNRSAEQGIDVDFTLPDYYPPVNKILKCKTTPRIGAAAINGQTLSCEGSLNVLLIYVSSEGELCSYEYIMPFSKNFEFEGDNNDCMPSCSVKEEYMNCRLMNERKVELHGALGITACIIKKNCEKVICDIDGGNVVVNRELAPATSVLGIAEKYLTIEEDLELGNGQPSIRYLLRYDAKAFNTDCKTISGKAVVKGEMTVFVLYCGEGTATPQTLCSTIPFSQIIDIDGITDECECNCTAEIAALEIKPRTSVTGETRNLSLCAKLRFTATATCNDDMPVICDAFSTKYNADINLSDVTIEKIVKTVNDRFVCKSNIDLNVSGLNSVIDVWCDPKVNSCDIKDKEICVGGVINACILITDNDNNPLYLERNFDFTYSHPFMNGDENTYCSALVSVSRVSFTVLSNNCLEITSEIGICVTVMRKQKMSLLTDIRIDEKNKKGTERDCAMIIYYADCGEEVWNIARKYNSSPEEICEINSIEGKCIPSSQPLLIPIK